MGHSTEPKDATMNDYRLVRQAGANTLALVTLQTFTRIVTFALNAIVVRLTAPEVLGLASVKLELLYNTILFLSREGLRLALLRYTPPAPINPKPSDGEKTKKGASNVNEELKAEDSKIDDEREGEEKLWLRRLVHMSWLALPCAIPVILFFSGAYFWILPTEIVRLGLTFRFIISVATYVMMALWELALEPAYMICAHRQLIRQRIQVESIAMTFRVITVLTICLLLASPNNSTDLAHDLMVGLAAYPIGQVVYVLVLTGGLLRIIRWNAAIPFNGSFNTLLPYPKIDFDIATVEHALDMTKQVLFKYFLSQGDMWIVSLMAPLQDQGVYAVVSNYGSLICRILLQPTEESALSFFSQTISEEALVKLSQAEATQSRRRMGVEYLYVLIKIDILISLVTIVYGVPMSHIVVTTLLGSRWRSSIMSKALATYCFLIPVMAISGILESFIHATLTREWLNWYQYGSLGGTALYVLAAVFLTNTFGPIGLIIANILNFTFRAVLGIRYLGEYLKRHKMSSPMTIWPKISFNPLLYLYFLGLFTLFSNTIGESLVSTRTLIALASLPVTIMTLIIIERPFLLHLKNLFFGNNMAIKIE